MAGGSQSSFVERTWIVTGIVALTTVLLLVAWRGFAVLLTLFAGLLVAVLLRGATRWVQRRTGLSSTPALAVVCTTIALLAGGGAALTAASVSEQFSELADQLPLAFEQLRTRMAANPLGRRLVDSMTQAGGEGGATASQVFIAASAVVGSIANVVLVLFVGLFLAADPDSYRRPALLLVPPAGREHAAQLFDEIGAALERWLGGRLLLMAVIGALTWLGLLVLGVPLALPLGIIAGALSFIPNLGPIISAVPAMLMGAAEAPIMALYVALLYLGLQTAESYMLEPYVVRRTSDLPASAVIAFQLLMGTLAGIYGLMLATPLLVVLTILVGRLYVENASEDRTAGRA
jgi:predicted PurR-regulated permease PerM